MNKNKTYPEELFNNCNICYKEAEYSNKKFKFIRRFVIVIVILFIFSILIK